MQQYYDRYLRAIAWVIAGALVLQFSQSIRLPGLIIGWSAVGFGFIIALSKPFEQLNKCKKCKNIVKRIQDFDDQMTLPLFQLSVVDAVKAAVEAEKRTEVFWAFIVFLWVLLIMIVLDVFIGIAQKIKAGGKPIMHRYLRIFAVALPVFSLLFYALNFTNLGDPFYWLTSGVIILAVDFLFTNYSLRPQIVKKPIPELIRSDLAEIKTSLDSGTLKAAILTTGMTLDHIWQDMKLNNLKELYQKKLISKTTAEQAMRIRLWNNLIEHDFLNVTLTPNDVESAIEYVKKLISEIYLPDTPNNNE